MKSWTLFWRRRPISSARICRKCGSRTGENIKRSLPPTGGDRSLYVHAVPYSTGGVCSNLLRGHTAETKKRLSRRVLEEAFGRYFGGGGGIRTPGTQKGTPVFETGAFSQAPPPHRILCSHSMHLRRLPSICRLAVTQRLILRSEGAPSSCFYHSDTDADGRPRTGTRTVRRARFRPFREASGHSQTNQPKRGVQPRYLPAQRAKSEEGSILGRPAPLSIRCSPSMRKSPGMLRPYTLRECPQAPAR